MNSNVIQLQDMDSYQELLQQLLQLRSNVVKEAGEWLDSFRRYFPGEEYSKSAVNLSHYVVFRRRDLRHLQLELAQLGLSSLGRAETHLLSSLDNIILLLSAITRQPNPVSHMNTAPQFGEGYELLEQNTTRLFGEHNGVRKARIIVTLPTQAATDPILVKDLIRNGMDCARINTAHDDRETWASMIQNIRQACMVLNRECKVLIDLCGYKIRTCPIRVSPEVFHLKVKRGYFGETVGKARILVVPNGHPEFTQQSNHGAAIVLPVPMDIYRRMNIGDNLSFQDYRGKSREIEITENTPEGHWIGAITKSAYLSGSTAFSWFSNTNGFNKPLAEFIARIPAFDNYKIRVEKGDRVFLSAKDSVGYAPVCDDRGHLKKPASLAITLPQILKQTAIDDPVWFDDGKVGARIVEKSDAGVMLEITHAGPGGARIGAHKGINFPDTDLNLPSLSEKDLQDLDFICRHADMVGFSFVEKLENIRTLSAELDKRGARKMPIIAKIETKRAVKNLPEILLANQSAHPLGVMIARGDLAVELGSVRLAEIQEEILWLCEAAHVPVIWATQVLESITKSGTHSRAEFTDAAMSVRAEAVMLNKGDYVLDAVRSLSATLERMQDHQQKKISRLRALHW